MKKIFIIFAITITVCLCQITMSMASEWCGFKGIYVGMSADNLKKKGFNCTPSVGKSKNLHDAECVPGKGNKYFSSIGGEPIQELEVAIKDEKVISIYVKTKGAYGGGLEKVMVKQYGAASYKRGNWRNGYLTWERSKEAILLSLNNGLNWIYFTRDKKLDDDRAYNEKRKKAAKDF